MRHSCVVLVTVCVASLSLPARADEGRIPIFAPTVITAPGKYFVSRNLTGTTGPIITINSDSVDVDLNGAFLEGNNTDPAILVQSATGVTIRNGKLTNAGAPAISVSSALDVAIEDIHAFVAGGVGISLTEVAQFAIRRVAVVIYAGATTAIRANNTDPSLPMSGSIEKSIIDAANGAGISVTAPQATPATLAIVGNRIKSESPGIAVTWCAHCVIEENTVKTAAAPAIGLSMIRSRLINNVISTTSTSIGSAAADLTTDDTMILGNNVSGNPRRGLRVIGARNHIEGNILNANGSFGLTITGANNVYRRNTARGNGGVVADCATMCSADFCPAAGNSSAGDNFLPGPPAFPGCV